MAANETTSTYTLQLRDEISATADAAAGSLDALKSKIDQDSRALAEMNKAMRQLKAAGLGQSEAYKKLQADSKALSASIGQDRAKWIAMGGQFQATAKAVQDVGAAASSIGGPLSGAASRVSGLAGAFTSAAGVSALVVAGVAAIAYGLVRLASAALDAATAIGRYVLATASARREESLRLESLITLPSWINRSRGSVEELQGAIDAVSGSTRLGRGDVEKWTASLYRAGLRGDQLRTALRGVTTVASVQGEEMAQRFVGMAASARLTGRSVDALTASVERRLGPIARRQMLSWDAQTQHLRESFSGLFSDISTDGLMSAISPIFRIFDRGTVTGEAWRSIVNLLFGDMVSGAGGAQSAIQLLTEYVTLYALQATLAWYDFKDTIRELIPESWRNQFGAMDVLKGILIGIGVAAGVAALAFGLFAVAVLLLLSPFILLGIAIWKTLDAIDALVDWIGEAYDEISSMSWEELGSSLVDGFLRGIFGGQDSVIDGIKSLASGATDTLKNLLGIRSPSRVFAALGVEIPRGFAAGVEESAPAAYSAVGRFAEGTVSAYAAEESAPARSSSSTSISVGDVIVNVGEGADGDTIATTIRQELTTLFEGLAYSRGGSLV